MIKFRSVSDTDPALSHSPMVRAAEKTFAYIDELGPTGLTPSKTFKRVFVHWAAAEFDWPEYSEADLFAVNKVLNEMDLLTRRAGPLTRTPMCLSGCGGIKGTKRVAIGLTTCAACPSLWRRLKLPRFRLDVDRIADYSIASRLEFTGSIELKYSEISSLCL